MPEEQVQAAAAGFLVVWGLLLLASGLITGFVGYLVGRDKGRATSGFWLGFFFSIIGILIVAILQPALKTNLRRNPAPQGLRVPLNTEPLANERQRHIAEALRRDPSLGDSQDPESLRRLASAAEEIALEERVRRDLEAVQLDAERAAERARRQSMIEALEAKERSADEASRAREREFARLQAHKEQERLAAMSPARRWIIQNKTVSLLVLGVLLSVITVGLLFLFSQLQEQQRLQEKQQARELLLESCDPGQLSPEERTSPSTELLSSWVLCSSVAAREWVAQSSSLPPDLLATLRDDPEVSVRQIIANRSDLDEQSLKALAEDESVTIRATIAAREDLPEYLPAQMSQDPIEEVRIVAVKNPKLSAEAKEALLNDPSWEVRMNLARNSSSLNILQPLSLDPDIRVVGSAIAGLALEAFGSDGKARNEFLRAQLKACKFVQENDPDAVLEGSTVKIIDVCGYVLEYPPPD